MKKNAMFVFLILALAGVTYATPDCNKASDACSQPRQLSPFMSELVKVKQAVEIKPIQKKIAHKAADLTDKVAPVVSSQTLIAVQQVPAAAKPALSGPRWFLGAVGLLAVLFWFLRDNKKQKKNNANTAD